MLIDGLVGDDHGFGTENGTDNEGEKRDYDLDGMI